MTADLLGIPLTGLWIMPAGLPYAGWHVLLPGYALLCLGLGGWLLALLDARRGEKGPQHGAGHKTGHETRHKAGHGAQNGLLSTIRL